MSKTITLTPISEVLTKDEIKTIKSKGYKPKSHKCHHNSYFCGLDVRHYLGYEVNVCQGYLRGFIPHSWNAIVKNGVHYYVDFTSEWANKQDVVGRECELVLEVPNKTIGDIFAKEQNSFILFDGYYDNGNHIWYDENLNRHCEPIKTVRLSDLK